MPQTLTFTFDVDQTNEILLSLSKRADALTGLITQIQTQANAQLPPPAAAAAE